MTDKNRLEEAKKRRGQMRLIISTKTDKEFHDLMRGRQKER